MALLVLTHTAHVWEIVVLQAVAGTATAFFNPASTGLMPFTISPERLQQANALRGLSMASAGIVGTVLSGIVVTAVGPGWALAVDAASFGLSAFYLAQLRLPAQEKLAAQSFLADLHDGWREFSSRTWVWVIVLAASIGNMMTAVFSVLGAVISKESLGGPLAWAVIVAGLGIGSLIGGVVSLRLRVRHPLYFGSSLVGLLAIPTALLALGAPAVVVAAGALLAGGGNMIFNALWETSLQRHVPAIALSRVSAYDWFGSLACQPLGLVLAGPAAAALGTSKTLWISTAGIVGTAVMCVATPSVRQLES